MTPRVTIFFPALVGSVKIKCGLLDNLNQFSRFILWATCNGFAEERIIDTVDLGIYAVKDEMKYLQKIGFLDKSLRPTPQGDKFYSLITGIEDFNDRGIRIIINTFTGEVGPYEDGSIRENAAPENTLPSRFGNSIISRDNYAPLVALFNKSHADGLQIPDEYMEEIVPYIVIDESDRPLGIPYEYHPSESMDTPLLELTYDKPVWRFSLRDTSLDYYRHSLGSLAAIRDLDARLLSGFALGLLERHENEKTLNSTYGTMTVDLFRNCPLPDNIEPSSIFAVRALIGNLDENGIKEEVRRGIPEEYAMDMTGKGMEAGKIFAPVSHFRRMNGHGTQ